MRLRVDGLLKTRVHTTSSSTARMPETKEIDMAEGSPFYDKRYANKEFYWGKKPSAMCDRIIEVIQPNSQFHPKLLDLGSGEGRNAVYFAGNGFDVTCVDISLPGLEKTRRYAEELGLEVRTIHAEIITYEPEDTYDVIFSTGALHYLPPEVRKLQFENYKQATSSIGINALSVFVRKPFIPRPPDAEGTSYPWISGELMSYYGDWEIVYSTEEIFDCMSSGIPHKHAVNSVMTRR